MRRKLKWVVWMLFLFVGLMGCGGQTEREEKRKNEKIEEKAQREAGEENKEALQASEEMFRYDVSSGVSVFDVDEDGLLYTIDRMSTLNLQENGEFVAVQEFRLYDLSGTCIAQKEVEFGTETVMAMTISEDAIYCVANKDGDTYVYRVNKDTWEATELAKLTGFQSVNKIVLLGDYLYIFGNGEDATQNYTLHPDVFFFLYQGEQIYRINVTKNNPEQERIDVDYPISMYETEKNTLMIYQYTEEKGFGFTELNSEAFTLEEMEWSHGNSSRIGLSNCGDGYVYVEEFKMYYGTVEGTNAQILPDRVGLLLTSVYQDGFLFFRDLQQEPDTIKRFCVAAQIKENQEIRMLADEFRRDMPNSCGYQMNIHPATPEEFALKVLAQDRDFDTYLLSTREACAYNLKKNGAFYPLNEVEGVQEYLDACFPYVKELAYNEDGEIWMVPVGLAIPGIVYNKEFCRQNGVDYSQMNFLEYMSLLDRVETETPELASMGVCMLIEEFEMQYLSEYDSFDTEAARECLMKLREIYEKHGEWGTHSVYGRSLVTGIPEDFYATYNVYTSGAETIARAMRDSDIYGYTAVPRLSQHTKNVGTITLLAVNPQSERLEDTLEYISVFCKYMMNKKDSFLLADEAMYTDTPFIREQYELYANGDVNFRMELEVYRGDFDDYICGRKELEETIKEVERKRKIYVGE